MLYLIATPIGNLADVTYRAIETLKSVDFILCEDTRKSRILLNHYNISAQLRSYHQFSESQQEEELLELLKQGKDIALISDAGTPGINDPGERLVASCRQEGIEITSLPGPCSPITALTLSGMDTSRFQFVGFLPKKEGERKQLLLEALYYPGVTLFFESPKRLNQTLIEIAALGPEHPVTIARELTKLHEECLLGKAGDFVGRTWRGEVVVLLEGHAKIQVSLPPKEHVADLMNLYDLAKPEAIKLSAKLRGVSKKEIYSCFISDEIV